MCHYSIHRFNVHSFLYGCCYRSVQLQYINVYIFIYVYIYMCVCASKLIYTYTTIHSLVEIYWSICIASPDWHAYSMPFDFVWYYIWWCCTVVRLTFTSLQAMGLFFGLNGCMRNHFKTTPFLEGSWHMERVIELCVPWPVLAIQIPLLIVDPSVTPSIKHFRKRVIWFSGVSIFKTHIVNHMHLDVKIDGLYDTSYHATL